MTGYVVLRYRCGQGNRIIITDNKISLGFDERAFDGMSELELAMFLESELQQAIDQQANK